MAKKSQKRLVRYEKDKSGCMWGFISMFDFRHGHSTRKMIADKRRSSKHAVGVLHSKNKLEMSSNLDEVCQGNADIGESKRPSVIKPSVKKLIEEEMFMDRNAMKDSNNAETESKESRLRREVLVKLDSKRKNKSCKKNHDMDTNDLNLNPTLKSEIAHNQHSRKQSKDNLDLDKIIEEFCHLKDARSMMHGKDGEEILAQPNHKQTISENNARDAILELVNQMILNGKDLAEARRFLCSHQLMEALQIISSDKELFLSLLHNPNSLLFKCVQEFRSSEGTNDKEYGCITGSNFSEQDHGHIEQTREIVNHKKHNFFRKKVKSQSKSSTDENGNTDLSSRIVILKPGQMGLQKSDPESNLASLQTSHDSVKYNAPSVRGSSHFSLTEIKKKLKHAMGRDRHGNPEGISTRHTAEYQNKVRSSKAIGKDNLGMRSPSKDHFFIEKIARPTAGVMKGDKIGTIRDSELTREHENGSYPKQRVSSLYIEAKKHLSEMVGNGDENIDLSSRQISKTLGRILSLPEYNFSPLGSPGRDWEQHFVTAQTRFSTSDRNWEANKDNVSSKQGNFVGHLDQETDKDNAEKKSSICDESSNNEVPEVKSDSDHADKVENCGPIRDEIVPEGEIESAKERDVLESSSEAVVLGAGKENQNYDISEIPDSARCVQCLKQDVTEESKPSSPLLSPSHFSTTKKIEELENVTDVSSRPSPVSVLDTPFVEDGASPGYSGPQPVEVPVQPIHIQFEEQDSSPVNQINREKYCLEENELLYDYIKAVLQASGLTIDQLLMKCLSSDKILDPSLFDQVEFLSSQLCHDQKLLYDGINEVLMEVCHNYSVVSPCVSFVNPGIRSTPNIKRVILKVWEGIYWHVLPLPPPRSLDKIVRKDMEKSRAWMDLRFEAETVGFEMGEAILAELMEDTILNCVSKSTQSECSQLQIEYKDTENSTSV
ncbi:uncharacterized protein LOC113849450 [Abrus precatorius]|uniref:Uncharacterized protein LOC113849450 n=1 Tax=Abrus precatorius TaxID=3816 RepID=A0A8B8JWY6_ABRPR|nr:uncharacterized protein LOC113849450 [Abrus precatorius]